jgi:hypothetical protein
MRQRADELERRLRARLDALGAAPRPELLHVVMLPDFERPIVARPYVTTIRGMPLKVRAAFDEVGGVARSEDVCLP